MTDSDRFQKTKRNWIHIIFDRVFIDRQVMVRTEGRIRFFRISKPVQVVAAAVFAGLAGWAGFATVSFVAHEKIVAAKDNQIFDAKMTYRSLLSEVSAYQNKFSNLTEELKKNHVLMLGLVGKNVSLQQNLRTTKTRLKDTEVARREIDTARDDLTGKLSQIENEMQKMSTRNFELRGTLSTAETDLQTVLNERNRAVGQGRRMTRQIGDLENILSELQESEQAVLQRLIDQTNSNISSIEGVLDKTGLNVERLLAANSRGRNNLTGQGGPFIAAKPAATPAEKLKASLNNLDSRVERWVELRKLARRLPLAAPLDSFRLSSRYGKRRDPINKKWAMHYGLDFGGVIKTSVYVAAPGTVTFAGRNGRYGRMIEISHGNGLKTRYGHLHKILVKKGEKVENRQKIGLLGSSGRSTGPHLHYEVLIKGKPVDPWKFIKAGNYVYKG